MTMAWTTRSRSWNGDREIDHIGYGSSFGDPGGTVYSDEQRPRISSPGTRAGDIRRQVVEAAADMLRGNKDTSAGASYVEPAYDARFSAEPADRAAVDLYLALLQDRLPVYVRTMADLVTHTGYGSVEDNLLPVARASIDFYCEILSVKVSVFSRPAQLVRLREVMRARRLGPSAAEDRVARYLQEEQERGRVAPDIGALAAARLLLGACVSYAFTTMLMGEGDMPPRDEYVADMVRGLRLSP
jgi:AefR-like transcriptional repressor, C-terminal domain